MSVTSVQSLSREVEATQRAPQRLLLALLGELLERGISRPVRASFYLDVLESAGVAAPTTRAALDRMAVTGLLSRARVGRGVEFALTDHGRAVLEEASERVHSPHPFDPVGSGWTLVTFTVPEDQRTLRHRLRAALAWEGFAAVRDGLWIAPGEVDLVAALGGLKEELPAGAVIAFRARDLAAFPVADAARTAWDLARIRAAHERFAMEWNTAETIEAPPLAALTMLVADWLELLRSDPRLPFDYLGEDWPAQRTTEIYRARRAAWSAAAAEALAAAIPGD